jgi:hypothetical protein
MVVEAGVGLFNFLLLYWAYLVVSARLVKFSKALCVGPSLTITGKPNKMRIFSFKISPLAYFTMKSARNSCPIAFQAIHKTILSDSYIKTLVEDMLANTYVDAR